MRKLDTTLLRIGMALWAFFAYLIAIEAGLLSSRFRREGLFFPWQLWLLAGIFVVTVRDQLASMRCRACSQWKASSLRELFGMGKVIRQSCRERCASGELEGLSMDRSREGVLS
jgi:hypothetical protein